MKVRSLQALTLAKVVQEGEAFKDYACSGVLGHLVTQQVKTEYLTQAYRAKVIDRLERLKETTMAIEGSKLITRTTEADKIASVGLSGLRGRISQEYLLAISEISRVFIVPITTIKFTPDLSIPEIQELVIKNLKGTGVVSPRALEAVLQEQDPFS